MADTGSSIFNKQARERLNSPEDLDRYVRVTTPSAWLVVIAALLLVFGLLAWGIFGAVTTSVSGMCYVQDSAGDTPVAVCLLSPEARASVSEGDSCTVGGVSAHIATVPNTPLSHDEARNIVQSDYLLAALMEGDWAYPVYIRVDGPGANMLDPNVPLTMSITVERTAPISLVLG